MDQNPVEAVVKIAAQAREGKIDAARETVLELVRAAPELAAQWAIFARIMVSARVEREIETLLQEYGSAAARAFRKALDQVATALAPPPEEPPPEPAPEVPEEAPTAIGAEDLLARLEGFLERVQSVRGPDPLEGLQRFLERLGAQGKPEGDAGAGEEAAAGDGLAALEGFLARLASDRETHQAQRERTLAGLEGFLQRLTPPEGAAAQGRVLAGLEGFLGALRGSVEAGLAEREQQVLTGLEGFLGALNAVHRQRQDHTRALRDLESLLERLAPSAADAETGRALTALEAFLGRLAPAPGPAGRIVRDLEELLCNIGRFSETIPARSQESGV